MGDGFFCFRYCVLRRLLPFKEIRKTESCYPEISQSAHARPVLVFYFLHKCFQRSVSQAHEQAQLIALRCPLSPSSVNAVCVRPCRPLQTTALSRPYPLTSTLSPSLQVRDILVETRSGCCDPRSPDPAASEKQNAFPSPPYPSPQARCHSWRRKRRPYGGVYQGRGQGY